MKGIFRHKAIVLALGAAIGAGTLVGCSGGGSDSSASDDSSSGSVPVSGTGATLVGVFRDAPVSGLHFWSPSHHGYTDADGKFNYTEGEVVTFDFGPLKLGGATGKGVITPMDLMSRDADSEVVQAIARTLLRLDADNNPSGGIQLNDQVANILKSKMPNDFDFTSLLALDGDNSHDTPDPLTDALTALDLAVDETVTEAVNEGLITADVPVTYDDAVAHLVNDDMFRKNISKTPELPSAKAKLNIMTEYAPAMKSDETPYTPDTEGNCTVGINVSGVCKSKPIVATYTDGDWRYPSGAAADAFAAISRDDGLTWKRVNLSRTGDRDVVNTGDTDFPTGFKGESRKPVMMVKQNYVVVAWSDKYCKGGSPAYSLVDPSTEENVNEDLYGVAGNQGYVDYAAQNLDADRLQVAIDRAGGVLVPYSCVWAARGWVDTTTGGITWSKAERLTSGRRDAYQLVVAGADDAGFNITWQEDPEGLLAGSGDGPGDGFSGATVNHQTDVWSSLLKWSDFETAAVIDPSATEDDVDDNPNDPVELDAADGDITGTTGLQRVRLERFSMPVRLTDNAACNYQNLTSDGHKWCRVKADGTLADLDADDDGVVDSGFVDPAVIENPDTVEGSRINLSSLGMVNCDALVYSNDSSVGWVCQTVDGRLLDGDSGASRPNMFLQPYTKSDGSISAWAILGYEETKGTGAGPDDVDSLYADEGKNVVYDSFDFTKPNVIAAGDVVNLPERNRDTRDPIVLIDGDETHKPLYATENARRVRFILQGKKPSLGKDTDGDGVGDTGAGTVLIAIYKQGPEGKGRPSDIFARRMTVRNDDGTVKTGNPYAFKNFVCDEWDSTDPAMRQCLKGAQNLSSVEPTQLGDPEGTPDSDIYYAKLLDWSWSPANLEDESWDTPMTEARAHRGQIRGDFVIMGYTWTPNWAATRKGNDKFDFYVRRSFDGGKTWTTDPKAKVATEHCKWTNQYDQDSANDQLVCNDYAAGVDEPPRNVTLLRNSKESVIEPRVVAVPGSLKEKACKDESGAAVLCAEDTQNINVVAVTYGLAANVDLDGDGELESSEQFPTDMYYSRTTDKGTTFPTVEYIDSDGNAGERWDWLAKRADVEEGEAQVRLTPDGNKFYATWLAESMADYTGPDHFAGSDIWFRKIDYNVAAEPTDTVSTTDTTSDTEPGED